MPNGSSKNFPTPQSSPRSDVVIYDGQCVFCERQVSHLAKLDGRQRLAFVSLHSDFVTDQFPDLSYEEMMSQIYLIPAEEGKYSEHRHGGATALRYLTRRLPKLWILAPLLHIPFSLPVWSWLYQRIAERRYRIQGRQCDSDGTCNLHFGDKPQPQTTHETDRLKAHQSQN